MSTNDIFQIFAGSADAAPGKGVGEVLVSSPDSYADLKKRKGWRRILSNFAVTPFEWKGLQWKTVEHAFQAAKFETLDPELFRSFSLNSGSPLSRGTGEDARGKAILLNEEQRRVWDGKSAAILRELWSSKFSQNQEAREILLLTHPAQIWHAAPRTPKVRWTALEEIREELRSAQRNAPEHTTEAAMEPEPTPVAPPPKKASRSKKTAAVAPAAVAAAAAPVAAVAAAAAPAVQPQTLGVVPEGAVTNGVEEREQTAEMTAAIALADQDAAEKVNSGIRFCPVCRYYLFLEPTTETDENLYRLCRNCGYREQDTEGGLVMEMMVQEKSTEPYKILLNEFTRKDPRLPHIKGSIKCPDPACESNHGGKESDVIYIKYDSVNMLYLYICDVCGFRWRTRR